MRRAPVAPEPLRLALVVDKFPELSETFIAGEAQALRGLGHAVRIEARWHATTPNDASAAGLEVSVAADDRLSRKLLDLAWLVSRHPVRCIRDVRGQRRWRMEEPLRPLRNLAPSARRVARARDDHLHVHFAAGAALDALRIGRLLGLPWSVIAHAYDIYREPANLREKLARASFSASASDFTVRRLREVAGEPHAGRVHKLVLGVDADRFRRTTSYPGGRVVAAVGRLVEKKGFAHLLDAVAHLEGCAPVERVLMLGAGPLEAGLREQADRLGLAERVRWLGARPPDAVRELLEEADVFVMPCVVARDGDCDSSPVVVKEALAMEVPVVVSDGFGMEEVVDDRCGRRVPAGDPSALAAAIDEVLALPAEQRARMGAAGRARVVESWNVHAEAEKLVKLVRETAA